jgi:hypothetical protein
MLKKFLPETPDKYLNASTDLPLARFGHINQLVNAINNLEESSGNGTIQSIVEGDNISIDNTDPANPIISANVSDVNGFIRTISGDSVILVDDSDPENIVLSADIPDLTGFVRTVSGDSIISVDDTDPENIILTATVTGFVSSITSKDNTISVDNGDPENLDLSVTGFIPLTGTGSESITGDIEMNGNASIKAVGSLATNSLRVGTANNVLKTAQNTGTTSSEFITTYSTLEGGKCLIQATDSANDTTLVAVKASATAHSIEVDSDKSTFQGIEYVQDFSGKYSSNSLIARKDAPAIFVDSRAPAVGANKIGDIYINTSAITIYISVGTAVSDWKQIL